MRRPTLLPSSAPRTPRPRMRRGRTSLSGRTPRPASSSAAAGSAITARCRGRSTWAAHPTIWSGWPRPPAVVTGGSRGIGRAFVLEATRRGYDVVFTYRSREADAASTVELAAALGGEAESVRADLEDFEGVQAVASAARARGHASLLVNNAGIGEEFTLEALTRDAWERSVAINLTAPTFLAKVLKRDLWCARVAILNVSSDGGVAGSLHGAAYG